MNEFLINQIEEITKSLQELREVITNVNNSDTEEKVTNEYPDGKELQTKVLKRIASKLTGGSESNLKDLISLLFINYPSVLFSLIIKEVAIELDKRYEGHISECDYVFIVSTLDGGVAKIDTNNIVSYRTFAAFRTLDDAFYAIDEVPIINKLYNVMFG